MITNIIGYRWKVYYDSTLLHEDDEIFDTEEEAEEEAQSYIESKMRDYEIDGAEYDEDSFSTVIIDEGETYV